MQQVAMQADEDSETTYEVMICSGVELHGQVRKDTWYIEAVFTDRATAAMHWARLCRQLPDRRVLIVLVRATFDPVTRRFRDRVLDAREPVRSFVRTSLRLSPEGRLRLIEAFGTSAARARREEVVRKRVVRAAPVKRALLPRALAAGSLVAMLAAACAALALG